MRFLLLFFCGKYSEAVYSRLNREWFGTKCLFNTVHLYLTLKYNTVAFNLQTVFKHSCWYFGGFHFSFFIMKSSYRIFLFHFFGLLYHSSSWNYHIRFFFFIFHFFGLISHSSSFSFSDVDVHTVHVVTAAYYKYNINFLCQLYFNVGHDCATWIANFFFWGDANHCSNLGVFFFFFKYMWLCYVHQV